MSNSRLRITITLVSVLLVALATPAMALEYNPGVSVGQYVKYEVTENPETENTVAWFRWAVTAVSGTEVTLQRTGQFKNDTAFPEHSAIIDIAAGTANGTAHTLLPIQAANLNEGDAIPPPNTYKINKTETRTYLSIGRSVNIINTTSSTADYNMSLLVVFDRASGFMLEMEIETTQNEPVPTTSKVSDIVAETNIFVAEDTIIGLPADYFYAIAAIVIIIIAIIAAAAIMTRKRRRIVKP